MSKETKLLRLKEQLKRDLSEWLELEKERQIVTSELDKKKSAGATRRGMLESLTEAYFAKIMDIARDAADIEELEDRP